MTRSLALACASLAVIVAVCTGCGSDKGSGVACGALGEACCAGRTCTTGTCNGGGPGVCADCGQPGQVCCDLGTCGAGGCCINNICTGDGSTCPTLGGACTDGSCGGGTCGAAGQPCCAGECTAGAVTCVNGACATCGGPGEPCCQDRGCGPDLVCDNGACLQCGGPGEPCCPGDTCQAGCCDQGNQVCVADEAACPTGGTCSNNTCVCAGGQQNCGNGCEDTTRNVDQCGACATTCNDRQYCADSSCACRPGLVMGASGSCIDPNSNPQACGTPPVSCPTGTPFCANGTCTTACGGLDTCGNACVDTQTNPLHCGDCGNVCGRDEVCVQGNCESFDAAVGCTACPCPSCGGGDACCDYPNTTGSLICVGGGNGCPVGF